MFAPTKTWRKWHRKINTTQRRYAVASALAASAVPALVMARGHKVDDVPEIPLVLDSSLESTKKTSAAKDILAAVGALADVEKAIDSKKIRCGKGKMRNRRYTLRRGPLVIYKANDGVEQAFRNLPGVELCDVSRLNLLQLAPGGHMGRFCVWSQAAIDELNTIYGPDGKSIPSASMTNADLARIINSDEVQSIVKPALRAPKPRPRKKNAIKSVKALEKLDPYAAAARRAEAAAQANRVGKKAATLKAKRAMSKANKASKKAFYEQAVKQGDVCASGFNL
jgi:large subunit ribosomal protein L4e